MSILLNKPKQSALQAMLERAKARKLAEEQTTNQAPEIPVKLPESRVFEDNPEQAEFVRLAMTGQSCVLIGAAGTGKSTTLKRFIRELLATREIDTITDLTHKHLMAGIPGLLCASYTRPSVANLKKILPDLRENCLTLHKTLEYRPHFFEVEDPLTSNIRQTMRFEPSRHAKRKLDSGLKLIILDESGTIPIDLYDLLIDALEDPEKVQFIYLGDLNQLPPVFGPSVLGVKGLELQHNVIELKKVYRQALESPIIKLAHRVLSGLPLMASQYPQFSDEAKVTIHPWAKRISAHEALLTSAYFLQNKAKSGGYDYDKDMILIPQNVGFGADDLNKLLANYRARATGTVTFEILASWQKHYLSLGDSVFYNKEPYVIKEISRNGAYSGKLPQPESAFLDYFGHNLNQRAQAAAESVSSDEHLESILDDLSSDDFTSKTQASHLVTLIPKNALEDGDSAVELVLESASEINSLSLGYAMTVHKSQGSEWERVFLLFHHSHSQMIFRELLYTAITRARDQLYIICESDTFSKGIVSQRVKGQTIEEKLHYFADKVAKRNAEKSELVSDSEDSLN